jgi:hypothetical protein
MPASASKWKRAPRSGFGFRCGFLGLLHLEIIQERLTREYDLDLITTAPSVVYRSSCAAGETDERAKSCCTTRPTMPDPSRIEQIDEPWIKAVIYTPGRIPRLDPEAVPGPARDPDRPDLCRRPRAGATNCRSTKWCSISTTG